MRLKDTESGRRWLEQFTPEDRVAATLLIDAILVSTTDQIKSDIEAAIHEILVSQPGPFYIAPVISVEDVQRKCGLPPGSPAPRMFDDYQPLEQMSPEGGSENYLGLVARDVRKAYGKNATFSATGEEFAKVQKAGEQIRFIFIVDNSMSGTQVSTFLSSFWNSEKIRTLLNSPGASVQIHLICWGATPAVIEMLERTHESLKVNYVVVAEVPVVATSFPPGDSLDAVMVLIQKYPNKAKEVIGKRGLGFMDTGALFLPLGSSAPNNMPDLLIRNAKGKREGRYFALFPGRRISADIKALTPPPSPLPVRNPEAFNRRIRKQKLLTAYKITRGGRSKDWAMILLMALEYKPAAIRGELGLSYIEAQKLVRGLVNIGWATESYTLTESGNRNLRLFGRKRNYSEFKHGLRFVKNRFDGVPVAYYPSSVRGVR